MTPVDVADEIAAAVCVLSRHRIGAIILLEPAATVDGGLLLDALVSRAVLIAIAVPERINALHHGAIVIRGDRVERSGVPLSWADVVTHAADLAFATAVAVNEDAGEIRIANRTGAVTRVAHYELIEVLRLHVFALARSADGAR